MKYSNEYVEAIIKHLENTHQAWCFDEYGKVWTKETASLYLLSPSAWAART